MPAKAGTSKSGEPWMTPTVNIPTRRQQLPTGSGMQRILSIGSDKNNVLEHGTTRTSWHLAQPERPTSESPAVASGARPGGPTQGTG